MNTMKPRRYGETGTAPARRARVYRIGEEWYFAIRRGIDQGPYESERQARQALVKFIQEQLDFERRLCRKTQDDLSITHP